MDLARHLQTWSADQLARLFQHRPDLLPASDRGLEAVARKASTAVSLGRVLVEADVAMLVVAEAVVAAHPANVVELDELLGTEDPMGVLDAVERLAERAVVVIDHRFGDTHEGGGPGVVHPVGALSDLLHRPLGLGPSFVELVDHLPPNALERLAERTNAGGGGRSATARAVARRLTDPEVVADLVAEAPPGTAALLAELAAHRSPAIRLPRRGRAPQTADLADPQTEADALQWLRSCWLIVEVRDAGAELPRELAIAAHPDGWAPGAALRPVLIEPQPGLPNETVIGSAAEAANRMLDRAQALLDNVERGEVALRRAGGVGPRELSRLAAVAGGGPVAVARTLDLLAGARLVGVEDGRVVALPLAQKWWSLDRPRRYLVLARAWLGLERFLPDGQAALLGASRGDTPVDSGDGAEVAAAAAARAVAVAAMADVNPGLAWQPDRLAAAVVWQAPNLWGLGTPPPESLVARTVTEAALLGLVAEDAPAPTLRALQSNDEAATIEAAATIVGHDQNTVVVQSDLSALSFGPLTPSVARPLGDLADQAFADNGQTSTYRFSEESIRRALDRGWTPQTITDFLAAHSLAGIPQPLDYLIADVARKHGSLRVMGASAVILADDEVGAVEVASHRRASSLGLRLVAPTVLLSPLDPVSVVEGLRAMGFLPVADGVAVNVGARGGTRNDSAGGEETPRTGDSDSDSDEGNKADHVSVPADWLAPPLPTGPFEDEVADAVAALLNPANGGALDPQAGGPDPVDIRLRLTHHWGRPVRVRASVDGSPVEATGVVVGLDGGVAVLTSTGVVEIPTETITDIESA